MPGYPVPHRGVLCNIFVSSCEMAYAPPRFGTTGILAAVWAEALPDACDVVSPECHVWRAFVDSTTLEISYEDLEDLPVWLCQGLAAFTEAILRPEPEAYEDEY